MSFILVTVVVMEVMVGNDVYQSKHEADVLCLSDDLTTGQKYNHVTCGVFGNDLRLAGRRINLCRSRPSRKHFTR